MSLLAIVGVAVTTYVANKAKEKMDIPGAPIPDPTPNPNIILSSEDSIPDISRKRRVLPKPGSIVITKLPAEWHSGIYIGNNKIVEVQGGEDSKVRIVSPKEFRDDGLPRIGLNIFVACDKKNDTVISNRRILNRAKSQIGRKIEYLLIIDNCHQFSRGCITGNFKGNDGETIIETVQNLDKTIRKELNNKSKLVWYPWDYKYN